MKKEPRNYFLRVVDCEYFWEISWSYSVPYTCDAVRFGFWILALYSSFTATPKEPSIHLPLYLLLFSAIFCCTAPPIPPSALNCFPTAPSLSNGPPTFCAVPPIAPLAVIIPISSAYHPFKPPTYPLSSNTTIFTSSPTHKHSPLNIDPTAPSFENILVPVPWVFSPAAGCGGERESQQWIRRNRERRGERWKGARTEGKREKGEGRREGERQDTYHLIHRLVDPLGELAPRFHGAVAALLHCLGRVVTVHVICIIEMCL